MKCVKPALVTLLGDVVTVELESVARQRSTIDAEVTFFEYDVTISAD